VNPLALLRDYQIEGIKDLHCRWDAGATRVPLVLATGLGKTRMGVGIAHTYLLENPGRRVLFLAHTDELIEQAAKAFRAIAVGVTVGSSCNAPSLGHLPLVDIWTRREEDGDMEQEEKLWAPTQRGNLKSMHKADPGNGYRTVCKPHRLVGLLRTRTEAVASGLRICPRCDR